MIQSSFQSNKNLILFADGFCWVLEMDCIAKPRREKIQYTCLTLPHSLTLLRLGSVVLRLGKKADNFEIKERTL